MRITGTNHGIVCSLLLLFLLTLIQIKKGVRSRKYPHQRNQITFAGETCASSPMVLAQFLKIAFEWKIVSEGMRRSIKSAMAMVRTKQSHPVRRDFVGSACWLSSELTTITSRNITSDS